MQGKYIIVNELGCEVAILFDEIIGHSTVALGFNGVVAAGSFKTYIKKLEHKIEVDAYGKSTSLDIKSRGPLDYDAIERVLRVRDVL